MAFALKCVPTFRVRKYCRRSLIETVFSVAKRKLSCRAPGRSLLTQRRQALLLGLTYNLNRLRHESSASGCQQSQTACRFLPRNTAECTPADEPLSGAGMDAVNIFWTARGL